jgi:predicted amidohydrolase
MEARAREFGVPFVCADKSGIELAPVGYVGQSRIIRGDGTTAAEAPPTGEAVIASRLLLRKPRPVWVSDRRRDRLLNGQGCVRANQDGPRKVVVAAMPTRVVNERFTGGLGESLFEPLQRRGVKLLLANFDHEPAAEQFTLLGHAYDLHAVGFPHHADVRTLGSARVGCVAGQWARSFAASRALSLDGAEVLACFDCPEDRAILRARAMENRVYLLGVNDRWAIAIDPDGEILMETTREEAVVEIDLSAAGDKEVAPQTDIFNERRPALYRF